MPALAGGEADVVLKQDVLGVGRSADSGGDEFARSLVHDDEFLGKVVLGLILWKTIPLMGSQGVGLVGLREALEIPLRRSF